MSSDQAELVHEARKTIKRMRALVRLLRYEIGREEWRRANGSLREAGRQLSSARDAEVRLATLEGLVGRYPRALRSDGVKRLRARLDHERMALSEAEPDDGAIKQFKDLRQGLLRWDLLDNDFSTLAPGLHRIYRDGRRRHEGVRAERARDPEHVHAWRKRVKSLYYALDMLGGSDGSGLAKETRRADRLGEALGEEHDLWMLAGYVRGASGGDAYAGYPTGSAPSQPDGPGQTGGATDPFAGEEDARGTLLAVIERRRSRVRRRALKLGGRMYKRRPAKFVERVGRRLQA